MSVLPEAEKQTSLGTKIGVISDTHGLLRGEAIEFLETCDIIVHAGDIGKPEILEKMRSIAPTFAVRGNVDRAPWALDLPDKEFVEIDKKWFCLIHILSDLNLEPSGGFDAVISGHSHLPKVYKKDGVLYFNPGSAGPKRFRLPVSIGAITIRDARLESEIITLIP